MTIEQFEQRLKALLQQAEDAGLEVEEFCEVAEYVIETGWGRDIDHANS